MTELYICETCYAVTTRTTTAKCCDAGFGWPMKDIVTICLNPMMTSYKNLIDKICLNWCECCQAHVDAINELSELERLLEERTP